MIDALDEARASAASLTPEQQNDADAAQHLFNIAYCVERHLAAVSPSIPDVDRWACAQEIAPTCNGQGVVEPCRRWAREIVREQTRTEIALGHLEKKYALNDTGNGERFAIEHFENFRFLEDRKVWVRWDGKRWREATDADLHRAAKLVSKRMLAESLKNDDKELHAWAFSSLSRRGLSAMIECAKSESIFSSDSKQFDQNPDLLTVDNGTVDLRTGALLPHDREDMLTTITKIKYDPAATCPRWEKFLEEIFDGDAELIEFIRRSVGYSTTGHTREHAFFILYGGGRNGKGRFIKQLQALLGGAARSTRFQTFTATRELDGGNTPQLAALADARLVVAGEPDAGVRLSESTIKMLTGEDEINVCKKYENPFSYIPRYKIWLHCNHKPTVRGTDEGIWSRPRLIPFNVTFKTEKQFIKDGGKGVRRDPDKRLDAKLDAEHSGILLWAVRGAMAWYADGLGGSEKVSAATEIYRDESDRLGPFVEECIKVEEGKFSTNDKICDAYSSWCKRNLVDYQMDGQTLSKLLAARGFERGRNEKGIRGFKGVAVAQVGMMGGVA